MKGQADAQAWHPCIGDPDIIAPGDCRQASREGKRERRRQNGRQPTQPNRQSALWIAGAGGLPIPALVNLVHAGCGSSELRMEDPGMTKRGRILLGCHSRGR